MSEEPTGDAVDVPIVCTDCDTTSRIPLDEVGEQLERHNERFHDGESVAEVDPALKASLADLLAEDLGVFEAGTD